MARFCCQECSQFFSAEIRDGVTVRCTNCGTPVADPASKALPEEGTQTWQPDPATATATARDGTGTSVGGGGEKYVKIKAGDELRGFRIEEMIGAGAMAVVYRAIQLSLNRVVAIKILPRRFANNPLFVQQFDSETAMLASLNHPNIINIIDRGREGETYFFAMEFVEGTTLRDLMRSGRVPPEFMVKIFRQCGEALKCAHSKGIIHRDIKPANVMLNDQSNVKIADFGVAGIMAKGQQDKNAKRRVMGTPGYMSPEQQIDVAHTDGRSDIFSLGAVMYQVLTGKLPEKLPPDPPSKVNAKADSRLDPIVLKCLREHPEDRYQDAGEFLDVLGAYGAQLTRIGEVCPKCKAENPVTEKACLKCGADLSGLFDVCPDCGAENRRDVAICTGCGVDLQTLRQKVSVMITKRQERSADLVADGRYDEAIAGLQPIMRVKGKIYDRARAQAEHTIAMYTQQRMAQSQELLQQGQAQMAQGDVPGAIETWRSIPADSLPGVAPAALIKKAMATMAQCEALLKKANGLLAARRHEEAAAILAKVGPAWPQCPGLGEAQYQLQALQQTEQLIEYELGEVERLMAEGKYAEAKEAMDFAKASVPDHPRIKQKLQEIELQEKQQRLTDLANQAVENQEKGRYRRAARQWQTAAELFGDSNPRKAQLLENARSARQLAEEHGEAEEKDLPLLEEGSAQEESAGPKVAVRKQAETGGRKRTLLITGLVVLVLAIVAGVPAGLYLMQSQPDPEPPPPPPPNGENGGSKPGPKDPNPIPPKVPTDDYFTENFDEGEAVYWEFSKGEWTVQRAEGRRFLRGIATGADGAAAHKYFDKQDVGVEAWVHVDVSTPAPDGSDPSVALSVRRKGDSSVELRVSHTKDGAVARVNIIVAGSAVKQSDPVRLGPGEFEGTIRLDAIGDAVAGRVDGKLIATLYDLPSQVVRSGKAALTCSYCRARWDDVNLGPPKAANIPGDVKPPPPPPPPPPTLDPVTKAKAAPGVSGLVMTEYALTLAQSFNENASGWHAGIGPWERLPRGRYGFKRAASGAGFSTLGVFADVEVEARAISGNYGNNSKDKSFGLLARYKDAKNFIFFGIAGLGKKEWTVRLVASKDGKKTSLNVPGGPYALPGGNIPLRLVVKGQEACGYVNGKPVLVCRDLSDCAPGGGRAGLNIGRLPASFDSARVKVLQTGRPARLGSDTPGAVRLDVPARVKAEPVDPPALLKLGDCGATYVMLKDIEALSSKMTIRMKLVDSGEYPALSMCAAARPDDVSFVTTEIGKGGSVRVRLARTVSNRGEKDTRVYMGMPLFKINPNEPLTVSLSLSPKTFACSIADKTLTYTPGSLPLTTQPGGIGFRVTDMAVVIETVDVEL